MRFFILPVLALLLAAAVVPAAAAEVQNEKNKPRPPETAGQSAVPDDLTVDENAYRSLMQFLSALAIVKTHYVDPDKATYESLFQAALRGMMHELDPFCDYEPAGNSRELHDISPGAKAGIGITISLKNRMLEVVDVYPGGPAEKTGIRPGDIITGIDGEELRGKDMKECLDSLRGEPGSSVKLTVYRASADSTLEFTIRREVLLHKTVTGAKLIEPAAGIAYLRIVQFGASTPDELDQALENLKKHSMQMLVIDLRNNPGGLLKSAVQVCSRFLRPGLPVVSVEGRRTHENSTLRSIPCQTARPDLPVAILVNGNSASAAEILSACLQDYKRAVLIGEKTFGKGCVQTLIPFGRNDALRITTAKYFTPHRRVIHGQGIQPDIPVPLTNAQRFAITMHLNRRPGEIHLHNAGSARDVQLERAVEVMKAVNLFRNHPQTPTQPAGNKPHKTR